MSDNDIWAGTIGDKWLITRETAVENLVKQNEIMREALEKMSEHSGWCDGPLGCGCKAPIAIKALEEVEKRK